MTIQVTLRVQHCTSGVTEPPTEKVFDTFPVRLGRSAGSDYVFNDPTKYVSSEHARLYVEGEELILEDISANGVYLNSSERPVKKNTPISVEHGDVITIGTYTIAISVQRSFQEFDHLIETKIRTDTALSHRPTPAEPLPTETNQKPIEAPSTESRDLDWFEVIDEPPIQPQVTQNDQISDQPAGQEETLSANDELAAAFDTQKEKPDTPNNPILPPDLPSHEPHWQPENTPKKTPEKKAQEKPSAPRNIEIVLEAAGLSPADYSKLGEDFLSEQVGLLLKESTLGIMLLLRLRQETKKAVGSEMTIYRTGRENNPLKFATSETEALQRLLTVHQNSDQLMFDQAVREAVDDLKVHQVAMLEAMNVAVNATIAKFNPAILEQSLEKLHPITAKLPIKRNAALWQLFQNHYKEIKQEAVDNFGVLFLQEFRSAYEQSIRKLGRQPEPDSDIW